MSAIKFRALSFAVTSASARYFAVPAAFVGLVQLQADRLWVGEWDMGLQSAVNYSPIAVFAVAAGSVIDARTARHSLPDVTASTRGLSSHLTRVLASAAWGYLVLAVLVCLTLGINAATSPWRTPNFTIVIAGLAWITLHSALGWLIGWRLTLPIALPVALLCAWLGSAIPAATPDVGLALLSGIDDGGFPAGLAPRTPVIMLQAALMILLAVTFVLPPSWRQSSSLARRVAVTTTISVLVLTLVGLSALGPQRRRELVAVAEPKVCVVEPIPSCSFPDHDDRRRVTTQLAEEMWAPFRSSTGSVPAGISEDRLAHPDSWVGVNLWSSDQLSNAVELARATTSWRFCGEVLSDAEGNSSTDRNGSTMVATGSGADARVVWLVTQIDGLRLPGPPPPDLVPILSQPEAKQVAWWFARPADLQCV